MKYSAQAMNNNENNLPTSLLIPKTSPLANTKLRFAIRAIIIPERIAPKTPKSGALAQPNPLEWELRDIAACFQSLSGTFSMG